LELKDLLSPQHVRLGVRASDWRSAVTEAGRLLVDSGAVTDGYVHAMIRTVETLGPYVVIAPGIAMPHARPEDGVSRTAMALVRLASAVPFGHPTNDPVDLVIPLAAVDPDSHVRAMAQLAERLSDPEALSRLRAARTPHEAWVALTGRHDQEERR